MGVVEKSGVVAELSARELRSDRRHGSWRAITGGRGALRYPPEPAYNGPLKEDSQRRRPGRKRLKAEPCYSDRSNSGDQTRHEGAKARLPSGVRPFGTLGAVVRSVN